MEKKFEPAYRLNLQYFADGEGGTDEGGTDEGGAGTEETPAPLTLEAVQAMIKAENDKVRTEYSRKLKAEQDKVKELETANMTEQEKLELAQKEVAEQKALVAERENVIFARDALEKSGLKSTFLDFVKTNSEEDTTKRIETLKTEFDLAVAAGIEAHVKSTGRTFTKGSGPTESTMASSIAEQMNKQQTPASNGW